MHNVTECYRTILPVDLIVIIHISGNDYFCLWHLCLVYYIASVLWISHYTMVIPCSTSKSQRYIISFLCRNCLNTCISWTTCNSCRYRTSIILRVTPQTGTHLIIGNKSIHIILIQRSSVCNFYIFISTDSCIGRHCRTFEISTALITSYRNQALIRNFDRLDRMSCRCILQLIFNFSDIKSQRIIFCN